ncbi:MAG: DUF5112 domain-containing protein [Prevotella sp.]|nr:DUF5112 domain-containing protein [Prevotella sp.]
MFILGLFFFSACTSRHVEREVDKLNYFSYTFHYKDLDSASFYAKRALMLCGGYKSGRAEAYNNLAFVHIARMEYDEAATLLDSVYLSTDNQIELLVSDIQNMRLCQRKSRNRMFYDYRERAIGRIKRIEEDTFSLSPHLQRRFIYAKSEFSIVNSTYYYYVGLEKQSAEAFAKIDPYGEILQDTAQYLNYLYYVGSGGVILDRSAEETSQIEFEHLMKCYLLARQVGYVYWEANSLQAMSVHLVVESERKFLIENNPLAIGYINQDNMPDSLLAGYLAQKSLDLFTKFGDVYQIAGAHRTLALCYFELADYTSSLICLENALLDKRIEQAPDLVASLREYLSLVYSALDDKNNSDINRNAYLDLQEETRQDRQLEARASRLERISMQLNIMIAFVIILILAVIILFFLFRYLRRRKDRGKTIDNLLVPLRQWERANDDNINKLFERHEVINESLSIMSLHIENDKKRFLDNKAKISLVNNVMPFIDRIINEVRRLECGNETEEKRNKRYKYVVELTDYINEYNDVLTHWIQLQQGQLSLHIESFSMKELFDMLAKSAISFQLKGVTLDVVPTDAVVKADKILTLFMLNTLADNARKFTMEGGKVTLRAEQKEEYVEISVQDTGIGMSEEEMAGIFERKVYNGHGFGLMNCKGIMDKYRKYSKIFNVCGLFAESKKGKGSLFYFRLPKGVMRALVLITVLFNMITLSYAANVVDSITFCDEAANSEYLVMAGAYADSAYYCNVTGEYSRTLEFADSVILYLNEYYAALHSERDQFMVINEDGKDNPAELEWFRNDVPTDYDVILDIRNESAVAALALHKWELYKYNNKVYTQLFKERSADKGLSDYCLMMQKSSTNKYIAIVLLILLFIVVVIVYYFYYYRHVLFFRFCMERVDNINKILLSVADDEQKLEAIMSVDTRKYPEPLKNIIIQIKNALQRSKDMRNAQHQNIELAEDVLSRMCYEDEKYYVCNNVIDNCLSTLKHETMYYPSKIKQLVENQKDNIHAISEVVIYYKELYSILSQQVQGQTESVAFECKSLSLKEHFGIDGYVKGDKVLLRYMFDILKKQCGITRSDINVSSKDNKYIAFNVHCRNMRLGGEQCQNLFIPSVENIPFLICRQIVREIGELPNLHACGITAETTERGGVELHIILPGRINE